MTVNIDYEAVRADLQHAALLREVADAVVAQANKNTSVDIRAARSEVDDTPDGPSIIVGARHAGAVSVEYGTLFRYPSAPIRRAAIGLGLKVPE